MTERRVLLETRTGRLHIRPITIADSHATYDLIKDIYASTEMMCQLFSDKYPNVVDLENEIEDFQNSPGSFFLLAENDTGPVAYITVRTQGSAKLSHTAYLHMGVSGNARGNSVGRKILKEAIDRIESDRIIEILYLNVRADNVAAVHLYESAGFETIAVLNRDTKFEGKYYDGLLMRRFMSPAI